MVKHDDEARTPKTPRRPRADKEAHQAAFLGAYARCLDITRAAKAVPVERGAHYRWLREDPTYPARFEAVAREAADMVEAAAFDLAVKGKIIRVYHNGEMIDERRQPDGEMQRFLLSKLHPRYKDTDVIDQTINAARMADEIEKLRASLPGGKRPVTHPDAAAEGKG